MRLLVIMASEQINIFHIYTIKFCNTNFAIHAIQSLTVKQ